MNNILKPFKEYFTINKNGEYSHLKRTMLTVFHVRFVFVLFETLGFCKSARVVFPDLTIPVFLLLTNVFFWWMVSLLLIGNFFLCFPFFLLIDESDFQVGFLLFFFNLFHGREDLC